MSEPKRTVGPMGWAACLAGLILAGADGSVALQVIRAGGGLDPELAGQAVALLGGVIFFVWARTSPAGLVLTALSLWVYWGMAPVIGQLLTGPPSEIPIWLGPIEFVAFAFFPLAFFAWRGGVRRATAAASADE